ncbi:transposase [Trichocoleus sp. DQ-A2]|nr:transposase [Coleofasciculus sp. FACHB-T130]MBD1889347.1 transposase [Coleofasciculus sp. FACHB-SPT9]MBD1903575.1 transposase [Coleofasciculus sp. FACHB-125]MBD2087517.1 transposase [Coleofasciculus sp. FACHB-542]MBD2538410.1 transposase [Coleofasciculus sp. FACHB-SPT36]
MNAIVYRADNGIKWRNLPRDFPGCQTAYGYYRLCKIGHLGAFSIQPWCSKYELARDGRLKPV